MVNRDDKTITLKWSNSGRAEKVIIYRKENEGALTIYQTLEGNVDSFVDKGARMTNNTQYTYKIQAVYNNGIKAALSSEVKVSFKDALQ